ncbi:MAG: PRC-barrel domain-containing protein, partial [Chloroflexia bacterium]
MSYANDPMDLIVEGLGVYSADGDKLGEVGEVRIGARTGQVESQGVAEELSFFQIKRGPSGQAPDLWAPSSAVADVATDRVT